MLQNIHIEEGLYIIHTIQMQVLGINQKYHLDRVLDLEKQIQILDVYATCKNELQLKNQENDYSKIASLCNALLIFPVFQDSSINIELMIGVLLELTSKVKEEIHIKSCNDLLKSEMINQILKMRKEPRLNPFYLGKILEKLYIENKHHIKQNRLIHYFLI